MKKIILFFLILASPVHLFGESSEDHISFDGALTAGYVFKNDCLFKQVYGRGMVNAITADGCYYPWQHWGFGSKLSYWRARGHTTFLQLCSLVQEVPITFYARGIKRFDCGVHIYGSLGGGLVWVKEKSYLGTVKQTRGIGEVEAGLQYNVWRWLNLVGAFRYLFPAQKDGCDAVVIGGFDLRAGLGCSF